MNTPTEHQKTPLEIYEMFIWHLAFHPSGGSYARGNVYSYLCLDIIRKGKYSDRAVNQCLNMSSMVGDNFGAKFYKEFIAITPKLREMIVTKGRRVFKFLESDLTRNIKL